MQELSDDSVMKWYDTAGGVARACLSENKCGGEVGLHERICEVTRIVGAWRCIAEWW